MGADAMTTNEALKIVQALADGRDPTTGEQLSAEGQYQHPDVIRALHLAVRALERLEQREKREGSWPDTVLMTCDATLTQL